MNSKGSFAAIVSVALLVLIASIGFTYYSNGVSQKALLEQQDALELRQHFTQARYLIDKTAAHVLITNGVPIPAANPSNCWLSQPLNGNINHPIISILKREIDSALEESNGSIVCSVPEPNASWSVCSCTNPEISFPLTCTNGSVSLTLTVKIKKAYDGYASTCIVKDLQGNYNDN